MTRLHLVVGTAVALAANANVLRQPISSEPTSTILDKVTVGGVEYPLSEYGNTCQEVAPTSEVEVCGCKWKATMYLMTECGSGGSLGYSDYEVTAGTCDCSQSGCDSKELSSGYTSTFNWEAASVKIEKR